MAVDLPSFRDWYEKYKSLDEEVDAGSNPLEDVDGDDVDEEVVKQRICDYAHNVEVIQGFCRPCQQMFDNWPLDDFWFNHAECVWIGNTVQIESAAGKGCKFCALLLQFMNDDKILGRCRKIEARLEELIEPVDSRLCLFGGWVHLNYPGKSGEKWGHCCLSFNFDNGAYCRVALLSFSANLIIYRLVRRSYARPIPTH
jgi:hypothetical protein